MQLLIAGRCITLTVVSRMQRTATSLETSCRTLFTPMVQVLPVVAASRSLDTCRQTWSHERLPGCPHSLQSAGLEKLAVCLEQALMPLLNISSSEP